MFCPIFANKEKFHVIITEYDLRENGALYSMDPMTKMWVSLIAMLIMGCSVFLITFARSKTKGLIKGLLSLIAFVFMLVGFLGGVVSLM